MPTAEELAAKAAANAGAANQGQQGAGAAANTGAGTEDKNKTVPIAAMHEERTKRQMLEAKLKQMETVFEGKIAYDAQGNVIPLQPNQFQGGQQQVQEMDMRKQLDHMWETDPRKAVQTELGHALNWYDGINNSIEEQMDSIAGKVKDFDAYRGKVRTYLRKLPMDQRARPGIVEAAYFLQKGMGYDATLEQERERIQRTLQGAEGQQGLYSGGSGYQGGTGGEARRYTAEEAAVAKMYNMTPEQYFTGAK